MTANSFDKYIDKYGCVIGHKEDPGDSLHRTCMLFLGFHWFVDKWYHLPSMTLARFYHGNDLYIRHPSPGWWSEPDRLSRDQATPLVISLSVFGYDGYLRGFFLSHLKRFGFMTNTRRNGATKELHGTDKYLGHPEDGQYDYSWKLPDFIGPEFISVYIRAFNCWWLYPLLVICDVETLIGSLLWRYSKKGQTDVLNHMIVCEYANRVLPTPTGWLAKKLNDPDQFNRNLFYYFNRIGMPEMGELWRL